jgi:hypothetical protein
MLNSLDELLAHKEWFRDPRRSAAENAGPHVIVVDNFYEDPDLVAATGRSRDFVQYSPPLESQVGARLAHDPQFDGVTGSIFTTAMLAFRGIRVNEPMPGYRYNPPRLKARFEEILDVKIAPADWEPGGDWWNGAFNLREAGTDRLDTIHHHYHPTNNTARGWSGVVYMSREVPAGIKSGTSFWRDRRSGRCVAEFGELFSLERDKFECVYFVPYVYNRLIMFRENVLHKVEGGFGRGKAARMTQSFFFPVHDRQAV